MSSVKTPQEKKRHSYSKDYVVKGGENDKAFRKGWPKKNARLNRAERRKIAAVLHTPQILDADEKEAKTKSIVRPKVRKWGVLSLKEAIASKQEQRLRNYGARKASRGRYLF